jgi:nicotinamidase-related amidase
LAVSGGRDIVPEINRLLNLQSFVFKVATQDYHPANHISFASVHPPPNNQPFESFIEMKDVLGEQPGNSMQQRLWPDHCVQGTSGAELVDELDVNQIDLFVRKGMDERVEMYSAFSDNFGNMTAGAGGCSHDLAKVLHDKGVSDVFVVGLAGDYCVKETAIGAARAGFSTFLIEECQRCVDLKAWQDAKKYLTTSSVKVVSIDSEEVKRLG